MNDWSMIMKQLTLLGQIGLSLAMPLLICLFLCSWLVSHLGLGVWVYIPGFFFGLGGSMMTAYKLYIAEIKKQKKREKNPAEVSFNRHL